MQLFLTGFRLLFMKQITLLCLFTCLSFQLNAQDSLYFVEFGSSPSYCRTSGEQSGNGLIYASADGGVAPYEYQWKNLSTGDLQNNTTWGGLNPDCYEMTVIDMLGNVLKDTLCLDSINPKASFYLESDDLLGDGAYYYGLAPSTATFFNTSEDYYAPDPFSDTSVVFRPQGFEPWEEYPFLGEMMTYTYEYGGIYTATLIASNMNGCADTAHKTISISGPLGVEDEHSNEQPAVSVFSNNQIISIVTQQPSPDLIFRLYAISGALIDETSLVNSQMNLPINHHGLYLYEIINQKTGIQLKTGKLVIQ
jgi:hypothetical protein